MILGSNSVVTSDGRELNSLRNTILALLMSELDIDTDFTGQCGIFSDMSGNTIKLNDNLSQTAITPMATPTSDKHAIQL